MIARRFFSLLLACGLLPAMAVARGDAWRDDLMLSGFADNVIAGESLRGHPVLLQFWESWCRSCGQLMSDMDEVANRFPSVRHVVVSTDEDKADAERRLESHPLFAKHPDRFFHDSGRVLATRLDVTTVPTVVVLDAGGVELIRHSGHFNSSDLGRLVSVLSELGAPSGGTIP